MFIKGFKYISKNPNEEVGFFIMKFVSGELFIKRVSIINGSPSDKISHRIDFKNVDTKDMNDFLSRVLSTRYRYQAITEKQFNAYEKKFFEGFRNVSKSITGVTGSQSWNNWVKE